MKEIAKNLLQLIRTPNSQNTANWGQFEFPKEVEAFMDYVYNSGIWDGDYHDKLKELEKTNPKKMTLEDLHTYFTAIVCIERSFGGFLEQNTYDGTLEKLLVRYLELTKEETNRT